MGITKKILSVRKGSNSRKSINVEFLIDSGAVYSVVPQQTLKKLGLKPTRIEFFFLADGTKIERKVGEAFFTYNETQATSPVIFGEEGDSALLGAVTLETMGLVLNPFRREIYPMKHLLM